MPVEPNVEEKRQFPWPMAIGLVIVALIVLVVGFWSTRRSEQAVQKPLPFGAEEQAYAERIEFTEIRMGRAANFLDQEVTFINARLQNRGTRAIREIEVQVEFRNFEDKVVLSDKRRPFEPGSTPVSGGFSREIQMMFENVPADWNQQYPVIRVIGLSLE